ncbi:hypothetical protein ACN42_g3818 [Penicillium freii]|uniref:Secreted protein n=1 Tax=Penicillium freii TaxID=48697 RepID=A0A124GS45_PENFR|nr:hypothetical protein ACN42_g3818 [Penicillium freii]
MVISVSSAFAIGVVGAWELLAASPKDPKAFLDASVNFLCVSCSDSGVCGAVRMESCTESRTNLPWFL